MLFKGTVSLFMQASFVLDFRVIASSVECLWYITPLSTPDMHMYIPLRPRITRKTSFPIQFVFLYVHFWLSSCILLKEKSNDIAPIAHSPLLSWYNLVEPYAKTTYHILFYISYSLLKPGDKKLHHVPKHHATFSPYIAQERPYFVLLVSHILFLHYIPEPHATWQNIILHSLPRPHAKKNKSLFTCKLLVPN